LCPQHRQSGTDEEQRQRALRRKVQRSQQRRELGFGNALQCVQKEHECALRLFRCECRRLQKREQIVFQITVVGETGFRVKVQTDLDVGESEIYWEFRAVYKIFLNYQ